MHPRVGFLKKSARGRTNIEVGEFTYYDDPDGPEHFAEQLRATTTDFVGDRWSSASFCASPRASSSS
jgi:virginiamycin A acetyltransferase